MGRPLAHRPRKPIGTRDEQGYAVDAIYKLTVTYPTVLVMADPRRGEIFAFGPYDQKASLYELRHPSWIVGLYNRTSTPMGITDDLNAHWQANRSHVG